MRRGEARTEVDGPSPAARAASSGDPSPAAEDGQLSSEGVVMRTLNESEWVPVAGEPEPVAVEPPPEPEPPVMPEILEPAAEPDQDLSAKPEADVAATDGEPASEPLPPADPEPEAPPAE